MNFSFSTGGNSGQTGGKSGGFCGAIFGVLFGLVMVPAGFYAVYYGEARLVNHGEVWAKVALSPLETAAKSTQGLCKFGGKAKGEFLRVERYGKPVIYWDTDIEEYEQERDSDGNVEYEWNTVGGETKWASFSIGAIKITPDRANAIGEKVVFKGVKKGNATDYDPNVSDSSPSVGDRRLELSVIDAESDLLVMGEVTGQSCAGGSTFVVSTLDDAATEQALRTEYKIMYWVLKGGGGFAIWMGILLIFGPLMSLVGWIPFLGERLNGALALGALGVAAFAVAVVTFAIKFFWPLVAIAVIVIVALIYKGVRSPRVRPGAGAPPAVPPIAPLSE